MIVQFDPSKPVDYDLFLRIKTLPRYRFVGRTAEFPDEYATRIGLSESPSPIDHAYIPAPFLFDYQRDIAALAIRKRKFAAFVNCGLGKTNIFLEYARHAAAVLPPSKCILIVSPLMVVDQTIIEGARFYGDALPIEAIRARDLSRWLSAGTGRIGIVNYDALKSDVPQGRLGSLILDESSMLKSAYGKWGQECLRLGAGLDWKLALTGTPAPNDRIEYANHAVFLDAFPTVNAFLARFFVNRGQTDNRWELKPHALRPFYRALSHWCIFLSDPGVFGWRDNAGVVPPIEVHIHDVGLTADQEQAVREETGDLFAARPGGIGSRAKLSQIAKGHHRGRRFATNKPAFIRSLVDSWPGESTIIWCLYNEEQKSLEAIFPEAASIAGDTPHEERIKLIGEFQRGERRILLSKGKILGFGLNLQAATRQVFSSLVDSYETYFQCVKRSNRIGSDRPLNVHLPVSEVERPMIETVLRKARMVDQDTREQEAIFRDSMVEIQGATAC